MEGSRFQIGLDAAKELSLDKYPKDFLFIVNGKPYGCNRIVADIISPIIRKSQFADGSIDYFIFDTVNKSFDFSTFLACANFNEQTISIEQVPDFLEVCSKLGNESAYLSLFQGLHDALTNANVFSRLGSKMKFIEDFHKDTKENLIANHEFIKDEIDYIAAHFSEFKFDELKNLPEQVIIDVMDSDRFCVESEDSLLRFIIELYQQDKSKTYLFELIDYHNVSSDLIFEFMNIVDVNELNSRVWHSLSTKFVTPQTASKSNRTFIYKYVKRPKRFELTEVGKGVFNFLQSKLGPDLIESGVVAVEGNAKADTFPKIFNFTKIPGNKFFSKNEPNSYLQIDLKQLTLRLTSYEITSCEWVENSNHLKSWIVESSFDGQTWKEIDNQQNNNSINGKNKTFVFKISNPTSFARYFRIKITGPDWHNQNFLSLNRLELYGTLESAGDALSDLLEAPPKTDDKNAKKGNGKK